MENTVQNTAGTLVVIEAPNKARDLERARAALVLAESQAKIAAAALKSAQKASDAQPATDRIASKIAEAEQELDDLLNPPPIRKAKAKIAVLREQQHNEATTRVLADGARTKAFHANVQAQGRLADTKLAVQQAEQALSNERNRRGHSAELRPE